MKTLICGPYVGEFGWELFFWSGYCRALSRHFEKTIVVTRPGHDYLYSDFAVVDHYSPPISGISDCQNNSAVSINDMKNIINAYETPDAFWLPPFANAHGNYQPHWSQPLHIPTINGAIAPEYRERSRSIEEDRKLILIHARNRQSIRPEDNPPLEMFNELAQKLQNQGHEVASIGLSSDSHYVKGTVDERNISLDHLAHLMDGAICTLGTTSGPLHFASLVGCPVITWQADVDKMWYRFSTSWNPLNSKLVYINTVEEGGVHIHPKVKILMWAIDQIQRKNFRKLQIDNVL